MCGRYASSRRPEDLLEEFDVLESRVEVPLAPDYNVAPTKEVYAVVERPARGTGQAGGAGSGQVQGQAKGERQLRVLTWGLVPSWAKDPAIGSRMINARMETVAEKPAFRAAFAARRCLLPADGYFEWYVTERRGAGGKPVKQPYFIRPRDGSTLAMAGLYEIWRDPARADDDPQRFRWTCTVITTEASDDLGRIHDRMPLMVAPSQRDAWLSTTTPREALPGLLEPAAPGRLEAYAVSSRVGNVRHNGPELVEPLPPDPLPAEAGP